MPQSIPKGLSKEHVLLALAEIDAGTDHPFGSPTGYELIHGDRRYAPRAVIGLACRSLLGRVLLPQEFSGGEAPGQANFVLRELGFVVVRKDTAGASMETIDEIDSGSAWTRQEVDLIVADYFAMLRSELLGEPYSKAEHNRQLRPLLNGRSRSSVEYKHQNVSAVLVQMGLPYIDGYKPAANFQRAMLPRAIDDHLVRHPEFFETLADAPLLNPTFVPVIQGHSVEGYFDDPPESMVVTGGFEKPWLSRKGRRIDFARRDALNRQMGRLGEEFAVGVEKGRLVAFGRNDLAARVEWVAETWGDGVGFDVLSFDERDDSERFVEVKTTGLGKHFPFYVSANEVRCSEDCPERFRLYRVFHFARGPQIYVISGALSRECRLDPVQFRASI